MGGKQAFRHFGSGEEFLKSIARHVNKSVDYVVIDLKGASAAQIKTVKDFVSTLGKKQQERSYTSNNAYKAGSESVSKEK